MTESTDYGKILFRWIQKGRDFIEGHQKAPSLSEKEPAQEKEQKSEVLVNEEIDLQSIKFQQLIPIENWQSMSNHQQKHFLDHFMPIRIKCQLETKANQLCAFEELQHYECQRKTNEEGVMARWLDKKKTVIERLDPCVGIREEYEHCLERMMITLKTREVFGDEYKAYLKTFHFSKSQKEE